MLRTIVDPEPATADNIAGLERLIGVALPEDYRQFLKIYGGGRPEPSLFRVAWRGSDCAEWARRFPYDYVDVLCGLGPGETSTNLLASWEKFRGYIPNDMLMVGYDPGGNSLLLGISGERIGEVAIWPKEFGFLFSGEADGGDDPGNCWGHVAPTFGAFLDSLEDEPGA